MALNGFDSAQYIPLGLLTPTNGVSIWIYANLNGAGNNGFFDLPGSKHNTKAVGTVSITALPGNTGVIYLLQNIPASTAVSAGATTTVPDLTHYSNVLIPLQAGQTWFDNSWQINNIDPSNLYIGYATQGDGACGYVEYR